MKITVSQNQSLSRFWLLLALFAIAAAGVFSLPPVILRGPFFESVLPTKLIFDTSLILHVNLSVLVWMLAMAGAVWSSSARARLTFIYQLIAWTAAMGVALMVCSVFVGDPGPVKNNYVPMLQNLPFIMGLSLFGTAILLQALMVLIFHIPYLNQPLHLGMYGVAFVVVLSMVVLGISAHMISPFETLGAEHYYERLFWGGGHVLQFAYTSLMMVAWLWNAGVQHIHSPFAGRIVKILFAVNVLLVLPAPLMVISHDSLYESIAFFTRHMREWGGLVPAVLGIALLWRMGRYLNARQLASPIYSATLLSIILFGMGGLLGFMITETNTMVPAHYHGSIVGVTLALMGLVYHFLPELGYARPEGKMVASQPWIYGVGQLLHIGGLALMGGYGALRKAPGSTSDIDTVLGKAMFFSGGALAIIGGLLFVIVAFRCVLKGRE